MTSDQWTLGNSHGLHSWNTMPRSVRQRFRSEGKSQTTSEASGLRMDLLSHLALGLLGAHLSAGETTDILKYLQIWYIKLQESDTSIYLGSISPQVTPFILWTAIHKTFILRDLDVTWLELLESWGWRTTTHGSGFHSASQRWLSQESRVKTNIHCFVCWIDLSISKFKYDPPKHFL